MRFIMFVPSNESRDQPAEPSELRPIAQYGLVGLCATEGLAMKAAWFAPVRATYICDQPFVFFTLRPAPAPSTLVKPFTSSFEVGAVVPTPTLPALLRKNEGEKAAPLV